MGNTTSSRNATTAASIAKANKRTTSTATTEAEPLPSPTPSAMSTVADDSDNGSEAKLCAELHDAWKHEEDADEEVAAAHTASSPSPSLASPHVSTMKRKSTAASSRSSSPISSLHENLMRSQLERDPMQIYQIIEILGEGSMGSVARVRKRDSAVGGSARPNFVLSHSSDSKKPSSSPTKCCIQLGSVFCPGALFHPMQSKFVAPHDDEDEADTPVPPAPLIAAITPFGSFNTEMIKNKMAGGGGPGSESETCLSSNNSDVGSAASGSKRARSSTGTLLDLDDTNMTMTDFGSHSVPGSERRRRAMVLSHSRHSYTRRPSSRMITYGTKKEVYYALKSIHLDRCSSVAYKEELKNEVEILKQLDHPGIVRAIETFDYRDRLFIVLEICSGGDLYSRDPYTEESAQRILASLVSAISYLHSKGIVHRDIKFENVMFVNARSDEVKLIDFGLSQKFAANEHLHDAVGTVYTMAPELLAGDYDSKADVWSLGVIAYMLLSSSMPFYGKDRVHVIRKIMKGRFHFSSRRWKMVSTAAKDFVRQLLQMDPEGRPSADQALQATWLSQDFDTFGMAPEVEIMDNVQATIQAFAEYGTLKKLALMVIAYKSTTEEIGHLRQMFDRFDRRRTGEITLPEFKAALSEYYNYTNEELEAMFRGIDIDCTGSVHYSEFLAATIESHGSISEERLAEAFDRIDSDDSGYITVADLRNFLGADVRQESIDAIIDEADLTQDHRISYSEFLAQWNNDEDTRLKHCKQEVLSRHVSFVSSSVVSSSSTAEFGEQNGKTQKDAVAADLEAAAEILATSAPCARESFYFKKQKENSVRGVWF